MERSYLKERDELASAINAKLSQGFYIYHVGSNWIDFKKRDLTSAKITINPRTMGLEPHDLVEMISSTLGAAAWYSYERYELVLNLYNVSHGTSMQLEARPQGQPLTNAEVRELQVQTTNNLIPQSTNSLFVLALLAAAAYFLFKK